MKIIREELIEKLSNEPPFYLFKHKNYLCCILRMPWSGTLNGYVALTKQNSYFGKNYNDIDIDCHFGLTYSRYHLSSIEDNIFNNVWWIGFDTLHCDDLQPYIYDLESKYQDNRTYKDFDFVKNECIKIVDQIINIDDTYII